MKKASNLIRALFALTAVLIVTAVRPVVAAPPPIILPPIIPQSGYWAGPNPISPNSIALYTLFVTYYNDGPPTQAITSTSNLDYPLASVTFAASAGQFLGQTSYYHAPSVPTSSVIIQATVNAEAGGITVSRKISVQ